MYTFICFVSFFVIYLRHILIKTYTTFMQNTQNVSNYFTKNKVKRYLDEAPVKDLKPTDQQLSEWRMSPHRFTKIVNNTGDELKFTEARQITEFLNRFFSNLKPWELYDFHLNGNNQSDE